MPVTNHQRKHNSSLTGVARMLRKNMTDEEKHLWYDFLRDYPVRFLRQKVIDNYVADFYCHDARLVVEIDGSQHSTPEGRANDRVRTFRIESHGITVIRIPNFYINRYFPDMCSYIDSTVKKQMTDNN